MARKATRTATVETTLVAPSAVSLPQPQPKLPGTAALSSFHQRVFAEALTLKKGAASDRLTTALSEARVDLNPHQVEAAAFALDSLDRGGCLLADEVGLGKTIEAGLVMAQVLAEGAKKILVLCPASLRVQWQTELSSKFSIDSRLVDGRSAGPRGVRFGESEVTIASLGFGARHAEALAAVAWDLVVVDEAHRVRNSFQNKDSQGARLAAALNGRPKLLLTATPLQNSLGELFGLVSFLDPSVFGSYDAFAARYLKAGAEGPEPETLRDLKAELGGIAFRTLRRQVREYVRFTDRRSIVEDFSPTPEERALYDDVSEYLKRGKALGSTEGQRRMLVLLYRKLLGSSTFALGPTLLRLAETVEKRLGHAPAGAGLMEPDEPRAWEDDPSREFELVPAADVAVLEREVRELKAFARRAGEIKRNAKGDALCRALDRVFTVSRANLWPEKAVVFTESKRTLNYLSELLSSKGYAGQIAVLTGDLNTPEARAEVIERFRSSAKVLLSTEAGAEGLNLQFCNVVVNFDLPWNPQRVEQRIGRCHRYGQTRDVLVLNFLNQSNAAERRLFELLGKKLSLFDGVFGASDEILGALADGVDFERRVLEIYQNCRSEPEIDAAFSTLQNDLKASIDERVTNARALLFERFDTDVRKTLRFTQAATAAAVGSHRRMAETLTRATLGAPDATPAGIARARAAVVNAPARSFVPLRIDAATLPPHLQSLAHARGWWFCYRLDVGGAHPFGELCHLALVETAEGYRALEPKDAAALLEAQSREDASVSPPRTSVQATVGTLTDAAVQAFERRAREAFSQSAITHREELDRRVEVSLLPARNKVEAAQKAWEAARAAVRSGAGAAGPTAVRDHVARAETMYRKALSTLRDLELRAYAEKDKKSEQWDAQLRVKATRALVATACFAVEP